MRKTSTNNLPRKKTGPVNSIPTDWIGQHAVDPDEVRSFCLQHDLIADGNRAVNLAKRMLKPRHLRVVLEGDPEGSTEWLVLDVDIQGPVDEVLQTYHRFKEKWLAHLPDPKRGLVRLVYNII